MMENKNGFSSKNLDSSSNTNNAKTTSRKQLLIITIDIGEGKKEQIFIHENDDPTELALNFCQKNNLTNKIVPVLVKNINDNLQSVLKEK